LPRVTGDEQIEPDETPDPHGAYPRLSTEQVRCCGGAAASARSRRTTCSSESATRDPDLVVVLAGAVAVLDGAPPDARVLALHSRHRFVADLGQVIGRPVAVSAVAREQGEVLAVPDEQLRRLHPDRGRRGAGRCPGGAPGHAFLPVEDQLARRLRRRRRAKRIDKARTGRGGRGAMAVRYVHEHLSGARRSGS
jgi:CRP-like cAMP-binding protein